MEKNNRKITSIIDYKSIMPFIHMLDEYKEINETLVDEFEYDNKKYTIKKNNNTFEIGCSDGRFLFIGLGHFKNNSDEAYYLLTSYKIDEKEMVFKTNKISSLENENIYSRLVETGELYFTSGNGFERISFKENDSLNEFKVFGSEVKIEDDSLIIKPESEIGEDQNLSMAIRSALTLRSKILDGSITNYTFTGNELSVMHHMLKEELDKELETISNKKLENLKGVIKRLTPREQQMLKKMLD